MLAEIITIGDEILIGQVIDTNSAWIAQKLNEIGIRVKHITSIADERQEILNALDAASKRADVVLVTGGLGPTKDDVTKQTLCEYFNAKLILNEEALQNVKQLFQRFNRPLLDVNIKQAEVPDNCIVFQNANGTAPGMCFIQENTYFFSMPGVPFEMMSMLDDQVIPFLKQKITLPPVLHETILTAGIGESFLAKEIEDIEYQLPSHIKLAYLPKPGQVRLRLSGINENNPDLHLQLLTFKNKIAEKISTYVVALEDIPFEQVILNELQKNNKKLATAESCTGGYIGHLLTSIPGASNSYLGGAISYSYELKESMLGVSQETLTKYGAVSEETVREMVKGCLINYNADYAIACSGIAGPDGGTPEKPVGTVWIAVASHDHVKTHKFQFGNKRLQNIERTAISAFYMLFKLMNG